VGPLLLEWSAYRASESCGTLVPAVRYYLYQGNWFDTAVAATLMTLPVLILSTFLQRYLRETNLAGVMR